MFEKGSIAISPARMGILVLVFNTSSTIIFIPSSLFAQSGNAFWVAWFAAGMVGLAVLACMMSLMRRYPGQTLVDTGVQTIGYGFTLAVMIPFILFCLMLCSYIYFSVGAFFTTTMMRETPMIVFNGLIALVGAFTVRAGLQTMARMFSLLNLILLGSVTIVLLLGLPNYHPEYLLPVMPHGWKPILHSMYMSTGFVYGDFIVFAVIIGLVRVQKGEKCGKPVFLAFVLNWAILAIVSFCILMTLGPVTNDFRYPIFSMARIISIKEIIERGEAVIGMSLIAGSFMKSTIALYALNIGISRLLKLKDEKLLIFPLMLLCVYFSLVIVPTEAQYAEVLLTWPFVTFCGSLPLWTIAIAAAVRGRGKGGGKGGSGNASPESGSGELIGDNGENGAKSESGENGVNGESSDGVETSNDGEKSESGENAGDERESSDGVENSDDGEKSESGENAGDGESSDEDVSGNGGFKGIKGIRSIGGNTGGGLAFHGKPPRPIGDRTRRR